MKVLLIFVIVLLGIGITYFFVLGIMSKSGHSPGLSNNQLRPCSEKPNCVRSEAGTAETHFISPLLVPQVMDEKVMDKVALLITEMGGEIIIRSDHYLSAIFVSSIFRFMDDFEVRLDSSEGVIHIRSASRVGHSDFGVNKKRVEQFKTRFSG